jgi:hypothetical protein
MDLGPMGKICGAAFPLTVAVLIGLAAIEHLDDTLQLSAWCFAWALPWLAGCVAMDYAAALVEKTGKPLDRWVRYSRSLCGVASGLFWIGGSVTLIRHFPLAASQLKWAWAVFVAVLILAADAASSARRAAKDN